MMVISLDIDTLTHTCLFPAGMEFEENTQEPTPDVKVDSGE